MAEKKDRDLSPGYKRVFCAFCRSPRVVYSKKHLGGWDAFACLLLGFTLGLIVWQEVDPRFLPISVTLMGLAEVVTQMRWRISLPCRKCGFDPAVYVRSPKLAAERVRLVYEGRMANPNILEKNLPILDIKRATRGVALRPKDDSLPSKKL